MENKCRQKPLVMNLATAILMLAVILGACASPNPRAVISVEAPVLNQWQGDFPISQLHRLPEDLRASKVGYIGEVTGFADLWQVFKPGQPLPSVDFDRNLVVFVRNLDFYNRTRIGKVMVQDGVAEILAMETMSAAPIEDKAAMALAEIPRHGVRFLRAGDRRIPVP